MNNAPSVSAESLDAALAHQAPHLVRVLDQVLRRFTELERQVVPLDEPLDIDPDDLLRQLADAVNRRAYIATKNHDQAVAAILDATAQAAKDRFGYLSRGVGLSLAQLQADNARYAAASNG